MAKLITVICALLLGSSKALATNITILQNNGTPAVGVVVYLTALQNTPEIIAAKKEFSLSPTIISQQNKKFAPYLSVVTSNSDVTFNNKDDITHHIYSLNSDTRFDFKLRSNNNTKTLKFNQAESISMGCNIHDWMAGHLLVLDTPFYGITNESGTLHIEGIPKGNFNIGIYHPQIEKNDLQNSTVVNLPLTNPLVVKLEMPMSTTPPQQSLDDFEFIESY